MKHIIIGGVAGGATAAARIRRNDENAEIILIERGKYISYANCGLPYYIGGVIKEREKLFVQTPATFGQRFDVDVRVESEVIAIDKSKKEVTIKNPKGESYSESYDKLLLSPGSNPVRPPLKGIDNEGIFTLRNVNDTDNIKGYIKSKNIKSAIIVGAGFIGLEMAENLHIAGAKVSIIEMADQVMAPIDFSMASIVHQHLMQKGVNLMLGESVESFEKNSNNKLIVRTKSGREITTDIVILSIGVRPETTLAKAANLEIGQAGGIKVDNHLKTSDDNIYAVGDAIEFPHPITGKPWLNYLAGPANRQGRIVADNMVYGDIAEYEGSIGTSIAKVFDMTVAATGLPAKKLKAEGMEYVSSTTHSSSHAGYYPDSFPLTIKITFNPKDGKLYGAQCVGFDGVDKRIDQIALVIKRGGTISDLTLIEHTYAPPYSSAKDPVTMAGYVAENIISKRVKMVYWREVKDMDMSKITLIDVRTMEENKMGTIKGSINIPVDEIRLRLDEIPSDKPVYIFCAVGLRGYVASRILQANGYDVYNLSGGYKTFSNATAKITCKEDDLSCEISRIDPKEEVSDMNIKARTIKVDACGLQCPGPIMRVKKSIDEVAVGDRVEITSTDPGFARDIASWCRSTGNNLVEEHSDKGKFTALIEKGGANACKILTTCDGKGKTMIMFSDDLDKALATFVLANGAAATGQKVTIFFTFWGLNVIKKCNKPKGINKDIFGKMFGIMLPSNSLRLKLSKFNMFGAGSKMMRHIMKTKGIDSLESLRNQALENGVEFIACQMSMDVMGVSREELLDEVTIGGVATYMERADNANINLFI